jgi:hypothetical protein
MKTTYDFFSHTMNMSKDQQAKIIWMWIKQGLINQKVFVEIINRISERNVE